MSLSVPTNLSPELESDDDIDLDSIKEEVDVDQTVNEAHNFNDAHESSLERSLQNTPEQSLKSTSPLMKMKRKRRSRSRSTTKRRRSI